MPIRQGLIAISGILLLTGAVSCQGLLESDNALEAMPTDPGTAQGAGFLYGLRGQPVNYPEAMKLLIQAGSSGDALAMYYRGVALAEGWGESAPDIQGGRRLLDRAYLILRREAADGNVEALFAIGEITASGRLEAPDWELAEPIYRFCLEKNFLPAFREMGRHAVETGDYAGGIEYLTRATAEGDAVAEYWLARAYLGSRQNEMAREHLLSAARSGMPQAMYEVAVRAVDPAERERWMSRAAQAGIGEAQYELAMANIDAEPKLHQYWLNLAVTHGNAAAMRQMAQGRTLRSFEVNRMVLLVLASKYGEVAGIDEEIAAADADSGLYWPVQYSSLQVLNSGANYALLNLDILRIADDYRAGSVEAARQAFSQLVRTQGAALPPSLVWFHFWRRGLPLKWLAEETAATDTLGLATAAGLAGNSVRQRELAAKLAEEAARRTGEAKRIGSLLAAILSANAAMLEQDEATARAALQAVPAPTADEQLPALNFINEFCAPLRRNPEFPAAWLGVAPEQLKPSVLVIRQDF